MAYNKSDLVSKIAQKSNLTKAQAEAAVNAFQDVFVEAMQSGEGLKLTGLFSAERVKRAARTGRNPRGTVPRLAASTFRTSASSAQPAPAATRAPAKPSRFRQPTAFASLPAPC